MCAVCCACVVCVHVRACACGWPRGDAPACGSVQACAAGAQRSELCGPRAFCAPQSKLYGHNEDKDVVQHTGISLVIAATKYDAFEGADSEVKKVRRFHG